MVVGLGAAPSGASDFSDKNHPEYWEDLGYGTCVKNDKPSTPYTLGTPPTGTTWTLLVVKAGSESSTNDPHAEYHNPLPGPYYHPSGKTISHVIYCSKPGSGTTTTTTAATTTTRPGSTTSTTVGCGGYTPRNLTLSKTAAEPGETVTINGMAVAGDPLLITISGPNVTTRTLANVTAGPTGAFTVGVIVPDDYPSGKTYTITVKSVACNRTATVSITTQSVDRSGCGSGNPLVIIRNTATSWNLIAGNPPFDTAKPVTLTITRRVSGGATYTLYSGSWGTGVKTITVPNSAPEDRYFLVQSGSQKGNGKARTESCPVRVATSASLQATTISSSGNSPIQTGVVQVAIATLVGGAMLIRLRARRHAVVRA